MLCCWCLGVTSCIRPASCTPCSAPPALLPPRDGCGLDRWQRSQVQSHHTVRCRQSMTYRPVWRHTLGEPSALDGRSFVLKVDISRNRISVDWMQDGNTQYLATGVQTVALANKKAQLSLGKTRYSLYSSCCSTDLQGHSRSMIFMSYESHYDIFQPWPYLSPFPW